MKKYLFATLALFTLSYAENIEDLKKELEKQREIIIKLQERLNQLEQQQEILNQTKEKLQNLQTESSIDKILSNPFSQAKFVPDISLITDFSYVSRSLTDDTYKSVQIPGFNHGFFHSHGDHDHAPLNAERGFNFNYSELYVASTVDPYFDLVGVFHLHRDGFEIEEGYFQTRDLPYNLKLKGGKFYSEFGRLNKQHHHVWNFVDAPLIYRAVFGEENLNETGIQLSWLAPTPFYLLTGFEVFQGDNENNFNRNGFIVNTKKDGSGDNIKINDTKKPNLFTFFIKPSFDIGNTSILTGVSYAQGKTRINHLDDEDPHALSGDTKIYGFELTARHTLDSYRYLLLQSEYIYRKFDGTRFGYNNNGDLQTPRLERKQAGFYVEGIYKFAERWRAGLRYDLINKNDVFVNGRNKNLPDNMYKYSAMIDFLPSEFSRIRLQYNYDRSLFTEDLKRKPNN
ncbi:MAG: hypothetical protein JHC31_10410, partial [Sulfurihydrogenibium sp.]|nr:hypothetical protein [Sulfurihydrogenibium sp.]